MGNVLVKEETLTQIADAIREKSGSNDSYRPGEMPDAIMEISTYSGEGADPNKPVKFWGMDGELLYSYSLGEIASLEELPPLPEKNGFICQGWNWSLESIKYAEREVDIGAIFITDDGSTRIHVNLLSSTLDVVLGFGQSEANTVQVDWGDGSPTEWSDISGIYKTVAMPHSYKEAGNYVIKLIPDEGARICLLGADTKTSILRGSREENRSEMAYESAIRKVEIGACVERLYHYSCVMPALERVTIPQNVIYIDAAFEGSGKIEFLTLPNGLTKLENRLFSNCIALKRICFPDTNIVEMGTSCFHNCTSLESVTFPDTVTDLYSYLLGTCQSLQKFVVPKSLNYICSSMFYGCSNLREVVMHDDVVTIQDSAFASCESLGEIVLPASLERISNQMFSHCESLREVIIPDSVTEIGQNAFSYCLSLSAVIIPKSVLTIGQSAFGSCYGIKDYYFYANDPPTLSATNTFQYITNNCKIHVPKGCLEAYQTAEYWSTYADYMVEMEE